MTVDVEVASGLRGRLDAMRAAHASEPLPGWPTRARRLHALMTMLLAHRSEISAAIAADFGHRPVQETDLLELYPSLSTIRHALRHGRGWMRVRRAPAGFWFLPARIEIRPRPLGVVGVIVPWNYPLYLAIAPITDALAAGNRVLVKTSEWTPRFSELFAKIVARHFAPDELAVVVGDAGVAQAFSALPFDHLLFTGSTAVGREVMRAAAANLTPVTLELGGKSPAIIAPDARFEQAVERILVGTLVNAGQTCIAPDYVLLPRERVGDFVELARAIVERLYPGLDRNADYCGIASDRHHARLLALRDEAVAAGAQAHELAGVGDAMRRIAPTLLTGVAPAMRVLREEIFGPLLPLVPYDDLDEAIAYVAERDHPLALYLFAQDRELVERVLARTHAGGVCINDTLLHVAQHGLPFGGVGASGMGAYHGEHGFRRFSHLEPVFRQARWNAVGLLNPPFGPVFRRLLEILLRRG